MTLLGLLWVILVYKVEKSKVFIERPLFLEFSLISLDFFLIPGASNYSVSGESLILLLVCSVNIFTSYI